MMRIVFLSFLLLGVAFGDVLGANCPGSRIGNQKGELKTLMTGMLSCGTSGSEKWQEEHRAGGVLFERAKGPKDPVDPSHQVGTWHIDERGTDKKTNDWVCYDYSGGSRYCFQIYKHAGTYSFCDESGNEVATAVFRSIPSASVINACSF